MCTSIFYRRDVYTRMKLVQMVTITNGSDRWSKVVLLCVRWPAKLYAENVIHGV